MQLRMSATVGMVALTVLTFVAAGCGGSDNGSRADATATAAGNVPFDLAFIDAMVPHHRSAISMAKAAQTAGLTQPELVTIAGDIVGGQQKEIDEMLDWRDEWYGSRAVEPMNADSLEMSDEEMGMMGHDMEGEIADAEDVDAAFADAMIPHHKGAITMAELADERAQHQEIKDLAAAIISAQDREIAILEKHSTGMHH
jgi:uncharacterized protein (DUF305 family)